MPTPDPIALPELPEPCADTERGDYFTDDQMRAYGQACVDAAHPIPADMVLVPREATEEMARAGAQDVSCLSRFGAKVCYEAMIAAAPPLNEVFGNSEELPLNEPSGDSGQLASLEQRARELRVPDAPWRPISELPDSDDLFWFLGQIRPNDCVVDGPRQPQRGGYDADEWDYFCPAVSPPFTAALSAQPPAETVAWSEKEQAAISEMMAAQQLSYPALVRQAVRLYQRDWMRRRDGETCTWSGDEQRAREFSGDALSAQPREVAWRCFHCDEVFTDAESAALHFGNGGVMRQDEPACHVDIAKYRYMEALVSRYQEEDADVHRAMHRMAGEHHLALRRAEEDGYAKGLKDSGKCPCAAPQPREVRGVDGAWLGTDIDSLRSIVLDETGCMVGLALYIASPNDGGPTIRQGRYDSAFGFIDSTTGKWIDVDAWSAPILATTPPDGAKGEP